MKPNRSPKFGDVALAGVALGLIASIAIPLAIDPPGRAGQAVTMRNLRVIGVALQVYARDYDGMVVPAHGLGPEINGDPWVALLMPYVPDRTVFWDANRPYVGDETFPIGDGEYPWTWWQTLAINWNGYSSFYPEGDCTEWTGDYEYSRHIDSIEHPEHRIAVLPIRYGGTPVGWTFFALQASWPEMDAVHMDWSDFNCVWDSRLDYPGTRIPSLQADGSVHQLRPWDFIGWEEADTTEQFCTLATSRAHFSKWGRPWSGG